jgi:hypothetical protein
MDYINHTIPLNQTEIWELISTSIFAHPFHIHDVEFYILTINGALPPAEQRGWKDVILVRSNQTVRFIARFDDYADAEHPFMYHCHIALHEDEGMMGQFVVTEQPTQLPSMKLAESYATLYPNPASESIMVALSNPANQVYYISIKNMQGKTVMMLPQPELNKGIDIGELPAGMYIMEFTDKESKAHHTNRFIKE